MINLRRRGWCLRSYFMWVDEMAQRAEVQIKWVEECDSNLNIKHLNCD